MTPQDQERLAYIRMEAAKWTAQEKDAEQWDSVFLLRVVDELLSLQKVLK